MNWAGILSKNVKKRRQENWIYKGKIEITCTLCGKKIIRRTWLIMC